jgi:SAM-dependent methyltransferase
MTDPMHFERMAEGYASARPPYPAELWRDVLATGLVAPGRRALDLGAGTGQATGELLRRGMDVVAVEPGRRLADAIEERFPSAVVVRSKAEDIRPGEATFDLVVAATSIHWMNLDVLLPIIHRSLKPAGRLLIWRNVFGDAAAEVTPFRQEVQRIVAARPASGAVDHESIETITRALRGSTLFRVEKSRLYRWTVDLTTEQVRALFGTFSNWTPDEVETAASEVAALGGSVTESYTSWLIEASPV